MRAECPKKGIHGAAVGYEPRIYNDNIYVVPVKADITTDTAVVSRTVRAFYDRFEDVFDFVIVVNNLQRGEGRFPFLGSNAAVSNRVRRIGLDIVVDEQRQWGSNGKLTNVVHIVEHEGIRNGPMLHEVLHAWAAYVIKGFGGHWEFTGANGQLGGSDPRNLVDLGGGRYTVGNFPTDGYAENKRPYSAIERYLAGFLPPDQVPDLLVAENAAWLQEEGQTAIAENGYPIFTATGLRTGTIDHFVSLFGSREPAYSESQKNFRIYNFHKATGHVATIDMGGLTQHEKASAATRGPSGWGLGARPSPNDFSSGPEK